MESLLQQWRLLSRRDQTALLICGVALVCALLWWVVISPMQQSVAQQKSSTVAAGESYVRVQTMASELKSLRESGSRSSSNTDTPISQAVNRTLQQRGLVMGNFQPIRDNEARLRLDRAEYTKVVQWLIDLEQNYSIFSTELTVTPSSDSGVVSVNVRLSK